MYIPKRPSITWSHVYWHGFQEYSWEDFRIFSIKKILRATRNSSKFYAIIPFKELDCFTFDVITLCVKFLAIWDQFLNHFKLENRSLLLPKKKGNYCFHTILQSKIWDDLVRAFNIFCDMCWQVVTRLCLEMFYKIELERK